MSFLADIFRTQAVRTIENSGAEVYLSFDDGPDPRTTPRILEILRANESKATFFLVAEKARRHPELVRQILSDGHAIGNHSLDHRFVAFFGGKNRMLDWIDKSEKVFSDLGVPDSVGFRPPVGIVTPELAWALKLRNLHLILWDTRFFDTVFNWTEACARRSAQSVRGGAIVLLHDRTGVRWLDHSGIALEKYISTARARGFSFQALTRGLCEKQILIGRQKTSTGESKDD